MWGLINCKKHFAGKLGHGSIHWFEPNLHKDENFAKRILAETNGIEAHTEKVGKGKYKDYYRHIADAVGQCMDKSHK